MNDNPAQHNRFFHLALWTAQIMVATFLITGAVMKFLPIAQISAMMPWTGQVPPLIVRLLGLLDMLGALGLILPALFRIKPELTFWAAISVIALMICAIIFHVSRGEASVIGINIFTIFVSSFIAWARRRKAPVMPG